MAPAEEQKPGIRGNVEWRLVEAVELLIHGRV
jgi:hypothetical protein